mmetsp:Transcript_15333/g.31107  ORF Transcript_15333/g.31107 Transcript_15333/m.31107 type:complete len:119 (-) Transcript_15333:393-749(-)
MPTVAQSPRLMAIGCRTRPNQRLKAGIHFRSPLVSPSLLRRRYMVPRSQDPEEILGEMVTDKGEMEHRKKSSFDAVGDAIAQLDQCLGGNNTACEMLERNMEDDSLEGTPMERPDEGY